MRADILNPLFAEVSLLRSPSACRPISHSDASEGGCEAALFGCSIPTRHAIFALK
jgi:hypothetical protein